ncbi:DUF3426 domain-containing protein [Marinobacter salicampi]|uniref:DUF3426 domain-containing protein n=1 Tax=Marinobacter salicampi TaxID=435907 RepID=UPI00140CCDDC|nr:DUF3426 domain-containing protein [Marinobacter salicampi]
MTESTLLTRCPHCATRFRVTNEQLGIAKGKVRCGNCMEVFNAIEHQEKDGGKPAAAPASPIGTDSADATEEDFVFQDNPDEDATEGSYAGNQSTFSDDELSDSFRSFEEKTTSGFDAPDDDDHSENIDESWAEAILSEESPPSRSFPPHKPQEPESPADEPDLEPQADKPGQIGYQAEEFPGSGTQEPQKPAFELAPDPDQPVPEEPGSDLDAASEPSLAAEPRATAETYRNLSYEPIAVGKSPSRGWLRKTVWSLVILALLATLIAQVSYFQFDRLSAQPELRPIYEKACDLVGCELEPLSAIDQIQSRKLVVRTDPEDRNALIVDAVIVNEAAFEQPFPAIGLTFSNLNGDVVAQSVFSPEDYLAGDAQDMEAMPPDTPVRIAINIRDPGRDAVNYNISFRPR